LGLDASSLKKKVTTFTGPNARSNYLFRRVFTRLGAGGTGLNARLQAGIRDHAPLQCVDRNDEMSEPTSSDRREAMATYYFNLKGHHGRYVDPHGTELPDLAQAKEHARQVALELMHRRELKTRSWRLEVCDAQRMPIFELLFATVDPMLAQQLPPPLRSTVEELSARTGGMVDAIVDVRNTILQLRGTLAKCNREPYLAALDGTAL